MNLRLYLKNNIQREILKIALIFTLVSFLFSSHIYLKKINTAINEDIKKLEIIESKIQRTSNIVKTLEKISLPELKTPELLLASLLDNLKSKFPETTFEISEIKKENLETLCYFSLKGESNFQRLTDSLRFIEELSYPVIMIKSVSLKSEDSIINFEIKGEIRIISIKNERKT